MPSISGKDQSSHMGGFAQRAQSEPIYRQCIAALTDEELERELLHIRSMLKTAPNGPHYEDVWKHDCLKDECTRRGGISDEGFVLNHGPTGFQLLKREFDLPAETLELPPKLKRELTICNLFVNHRLRAIDIIRVLDESYESIVLSLIKHEVVLDRRQNPSTVGIERRRSTVRATSASR